MLQPYGPYGRVPARAAVLACVLACAAPADALDPALDVNQYVHMSWRVRDGFAKGAIQALAQTSDGYLWLGTDSGLLRFDGVRTVPWPDDADRRLPSRTIMSLLAAREGTLWIGTAQGLAAWKDGRLSSFAELAGYYIFALLEDREGVVWVGATGVPTGKLCAIRKDGVACHEDGRMGRGVLSLYEDRGGQLWAGVNDGVWRFKPGAPRFYGLLPRTAVNGFAEDTHGGLLVGAARGGVVRLLDGRIDAFTLSGFDRGSSMRRILRDRNGGLWFATSQGLLHEHAGRTDSFRRMDGLSSDAVNALLEDREGNVWVGTEAGLDRFRDPAVTTFSTKQGLSDAGVFSVLAAEDGSVWCAGPRGLNRWADGRMTVPRTGGATLDGKVDGATPLALFQDGRGRLWITTMRGIGYLEDERFVPVRGAPGGVVRAIAEDTAGTLWLSNQDAGLLGVSGGMLVQQIPWTKLGHEDFATAMIADPVRGGLWLGFFRGGIAHVVDAQVRTSCGTQDGLGAGYVASFRTFADGTLWIATAGGLTRSKDGRLSTLTSQDGLPCDDVQWAMEEDERALWLYTACGLVRIDRGDIDAWAAERDAARGDAAGKSMRPIRMSVFDLSDGVRSHPGAGGGSPNVSRSSDGRIWFLPWDGVSVLDPRRLPLNMLPPPVHIEQIIADRKTYAASAAAAGGLRLPALVRDLQIDYTAPSLAAPDKVRFRYMLEGRDRGWQEAGARRQAFYNDLPPGRYRFRMTASNNSGMWNDAGTSIDFSIAPAYYQTAWFRALGLTALLALAAGIYRLRIGQATRQVRLRMEARLDERERIARDLHDTLLQGVQGLILKVHGVAKKMPVEDPARIAIEETLDRADEVLAEGRDRVRSLRTGGLGDLPAALERVAREAKPEGGTRFTSVVEGRTRELDPIVLEETFAIGREALLNALTHSGGVHIEMEIAYDPRQFRLRIRDDGRGIDEQILRSGGRSDHWGMQGMHERALRIGARLEVWSRPGAGTEVQLTVPAATAYRDSGARSLASRLGRVGDLS